MGEQSFVKVRKTIATLLLVCFLLSVTAAVTCAGIDPSWDDKQLRDYNKAYSKFKQYGYKEAIEKGKGDGNKDCREGKVNSGGDSSVGFKNALDTTPKEVGAADGWNVGYNEGYSRGYDYGYAKCQDDGQFNTKTPGSIMRRPRGT